MNCDQALELMLDADVSELSATSVTPLGDHLRGCTWCQRVGSQLVEDTRSLASAMAIPVVNQRSRWARRAWESAPVVVAAGILVMLTLQVRQPATVPNLPNVLPTVVVSGMRPAPEVPSSARPASSPPRTRGSMVSSSPRTRGSSALAVRAFPAAQSIKTVAMTVPPRDATLPPRVESNAVTVTPPAGTRAVVMQTGDPKLVVVWLYDPEESR